MSLTRRESAILTTYTGILCGSFSDMHEYIEELAGRPVFTHELANREFVDELKALSKPDFLKLVGSIEK